MAVQRVGVEHQRPARSTAPCGSTSRTASPPPQPHATAIAARSSASQGLQHQVGLAWRPRASAALSSKADEHAAGACMQRGRRGQQGGARHARRAADHGHVAIAALVRGVQARGDRARRRRTARRWACVGRAHAQVVEPHLARGVAPAASEQAGLQRSAGSACAWPARAAPAPGVGVQPRRQVDGEHRSAGSRSWPRPTAAMAPSSGRVLPMPEQGVDGRGPIARAARSANAHAGLAGALQRRARVGGRLGLVARAR